MFNRVSVRLLRQVRNASLKTEIGVIGVPFENGQRKVGVGNAPKFLRDAGLIKSLQKIHDKIDVKDYGDIVYSIDHDISNSVPNMLMYEHMVACTKVLSKQVTRVLNDGRICLTLGGDHSIALATVDGHLQAKSDVAVLWIDAHADINTNLTSDSGNLHGMPVALLAKELSDYWPYLPGMDWQKPVMSIRNIGYIGLRSVDSFERLLIDNLGITAFGMEEIEKYGIHQCVHMALDRIDPTHTKSLHVSFDIDSIDSLEAPSTGTPVRGGLTLREGIHLMEIVHKTGRLNAIDLVEVNPSIGTGHDVALTVSAATHIITAAFGYSRKGLRPKVHDLPIQTPPSST
ncbi:hypothetical protein PPYR_01827 [Photinus pyralis]|uniref:Arginase n=3 Tax=Photinus pyralis TaxID=7054 RepID=A0A5N4B5G5_PHOPY|nr:arginase-1-like [Photinus pyralis]KAB0804857.1 hypothetical protein PPYR_01827 [Photinus pyralis]